MDGLVGCEMDVGSIRAQVELGLVRRPGELDVFRGGRDLDAAEALGLGDGLLGPGTGIDVVGLVCAAQQVHRDHRKLAGGPALQEQHLVTLRHGQKLAQVGFRLLGDGHELLSAVAHLRDAHAAAMPVQHLLPGLPQHLFRQHGRTGAEIESSSHSQLSVVTLCNQTIRRRIRSGNSRISDVCGSIRLQRRRLRRPHHPRPGRRFAPRSRAAGLRRGGSASPPGCCGSAPESRPRWCAPGFLPR